MAAFCDYCRTIPINLFSFRRDTQCTHDHQPTVHDLKISAVAGCPGCCLFLHAIESSSSEHAGKYSLKRTWKGDERVRLSSSKFGDQIVNLDYIEAGRFRSFAIPSEWQSEEPPAAVDRAKYSSAYLSYEAQLLQRWSKVCLEGHKCCEGSKPFLPTRLIDVGASDQPTLALVQSESLDVAESKYLALSHCWGLNMPAGAKTTSLTLEERHKSISIDELPLTFRDFIGIARRISIRYVWIDSLCIIQDSRQDWEKEAAQMASVYSSAYLTIAASSSSSGREGCHVHDEVRSYGPVDLECRSGEGPNTIFRLWSRDTFPVAQVLTSDPLSTRGWCLQERELSPRIVFYSKDSIRWECRKMRATLEFPWGDSGSFDKGRFFDGGTSSRPTTVGLPINDSKPLDTVTKQRLAWLELVQAYTSRSLTKQTDILPALSGIARSLAESTSDEYYAGLWKSFLPHCLLWASDWHVSRGFRQHSRPLEYLAPSWSWASVKGPIHYPSWINGYWFTFNADPNPEYLPKIISVSVEPMSDPYGAVKAGALTIQGKIGLVFACQEAYAQPKDKLNVSFTNGLQDRINLYKAGPAGTPEKVGEVRYDVPLCSDCAPIGSTRILWLLCCMNSEMRNGFMRTFAIALEAEGTDESQEAPLAFTGRFRRVGVAWGIDPSFWQSAINMPPIVII